MMYGLTDNIRFLRGVGSKRAEVLEKIGIHTVGDLLSYYPKNYSDFTQQSCVSHQAVNQVITTKVQVMSEAFSHKGTKRFTFLKQRVRDDEGEFFLVWFNQPYMKYKYKVGDDIIVSGKVTLLGKELQIVNPICEQAGSEKKSGSIFPIYAQTKGLRSDAISKLMMTALSDYSHHIGETIPDYIREKYDLESREWSIREIHFPQSSDSLQEAIRRLKFEELLVLQMSLLNIKSKSHEHCTGIALEDGGRTKSLLSSLSFVLTSAQQRVLDEIFMDMDSHNKMTRLLQGDVGSGKTIIAFLSMLKSIFAGYQSVLLAPTEILAKQHSDGLKILLKQLGLEEIVYCEILTGGMSMSKKNEVKQKIKSGVVHAVIGTHALFQENVLFQKLGLVVTDEQHRFGVMQRGRMESKSIHSDVLVMSATPIPRTLALILYGDLDVSVIDELPPGRQEIKTYTINQSLLSRMYVFVREQIDQGRQVYMVCPVIEESGESMTSAEQLFEQLKKGELRTYHIELLHGKISSEEKERILNSFVSNKTQVLIATTIIEVGINVPNATIMVIYNADRFGLSQLHQLRGRVGRGEFQSYCILVNNNSSELSWKRMKILEQSNDGFVISKKDLELRGPGDFFGTKQHGIPPFKLVHLFEDLDLLQEVQKLSFQIMKEDPMLDQPHNLFLKNAVDRMFLNLSDNVALN